MLKLNSLKLTGISTNAMKRLISINQFNFHKLNIINANINNDSKKSFNFIKFSNFFTNNIFNKNNKETNNLLIRYQRAGMRSMKSKRKARAPDPKYKMKTHNALKKRMRIVINYI
jgi:hypothetical protein